MSHKSIDMRWFVIQKDYLWKMVRYSSNVSKIMRCDRNYQSTALTWKTNKNWKINNFFCALLFDNRADKVHVEIRSDL